MTQETSDIATKQGGALATLDFVQDSGMGLENIDKGDLALPFLKLLQSGSDETKRKNMLNMLKAQKPVCFIIQLLKNCIVERRELKLIPVFYRMTYPRMGTF